MFKSVTVMLMTVLLCNPILSAQESAPEKAAPMQGHYVPRKTDPALKELRERDKARAKARDEETRKVRADLEKRRAKSRKKARRFVLDFHGVLKPESPEVFTSIFHFPPVRQYLTGSCWCFSTTSFLESEIHRLTGRKIKLSEMHTVYFEFVEKARGFLASRGGSAFEEGSEGNAVFRIWKQYGAVPAPVYGGVLDEDPRYDHSMMYREMKAYLDHVKAHDLWDENTVIPSIRLILDKYMGRPPERFLFEGKETTPLEFMEEVLRPPLDDYVCLMSFLQAPFYAFGEYEVSDNWWHSKAYYNVPLEVFYRIVKEALKRGYGVKLNGDVSEPGYVGEEDAAVVPDFDIPPAFIDQNARELRFRNKTTTDDHDIHAVGYTRRDGFDWFLIKDSASSAQHGRFKGYWFYRGDYVKLKMLTAIVHRDVVEAVVPSFPDPPSDAVPER